VSIKILIADDHAVFRASLTVLLEKEKDIEIMGEAGTGAEAIEASSWQELDVLILDISMPGLSGPVVAEEVLKKRPDLAIVVLTMHEDEYYLREMFRVGAKAFVLKTSSATDLVQAIRAAHRGEEYIDPGMTGHVISNYVARDHGNGRSDRVDMLTRREKEICTFLAYGHTNAEIARKAFISERTVESHRTNIMTKLKLKSRAELVRFAIDHGLLKLS
jgi:two-component system response regulator NreC